MQIILNNAAMVPIYEQLVCQIREQILRGVLAEETLLPSVRALAGELRISALTVKKAYDLLEEEGFVVTVHGKGTYVAAPNRELAAEQRRKQIEDRFSDAILYARASGMQTGEIRELMDILLED